ncbi:hypothetical protein [Plantactinospora sp. CA-290183]|uniref:hypothetical protein n=1 Tax=Plantactinospora sp. CA-290183 TaxID=3240006 RepID=UPI003D92572F
MRHQEQQFNGERAEDGRGEPVPVPVPGGVVPQSVDGPEDAIDERGSYDNDPDDRVGRDRSPEERAEDEAIDDDALTERTPSAGADPDPDPGTDRGDLADASQADARDANPAEPAGPGDDPGDDPSDDDPAGSGGSTRPEFHEPAPLPTAFGATSVGAAVAASAMASGNPADERDPREEDTVRPGDGVADDRIDGLGEDRIDAQRRAVRPTDDDGGPGGSDLGAADARGHLDPGAGPAGGDPDGTVAGGDPDGTVAVGVAPVTGARPAGTDDPVAATDGRSGPAADGGRTDGADSPGTPTTVGGEMLPGAVAAEPIVAILATDDVQGFRDRWRDVQLRFVDDPPNATADAHRLVEEAVEAVTTALTARRDDLGGWRRGDSTDTEQLRVAVRRYRDFLDRVLGL